jgi:putative nucleotidyltransferase with HDIG domain
VVAQRQLRKAVQARVPEKLTHVNAGDRIIDQGERVTTRHLAMLDAMKEELSENRKLWHWETLLGSLTLTLTLLYILYSYFHINHRHILESNRKLFLVATIVASTLILAKLLEYFLLRTQGNIAESVRYPVIVPYASILLCSLTSPAIAVVLSAFLTVLLTMTLAVDQHGFMIINLASALIAILSTRNLRRRKEVFAVCAKAWFTCGGLIIAMQLYDRTITGGLSFVSDLASVAFFLSLVAVLVVGVLPLLESAFQIMTDVTLMEYMDPNHDLLRRLSIEAPGTYQHSLVVGQLAETAALAIGANGLFCRVAALYHDVGKLTTPHYFTENQQGGMNMHQLLTPLESAQVIIAHVPEGVTMARKAGLPEQFVDIIKEHHGTTLVYYFYAKQVEQMGGDKSLVDERDFRYMGPKPRSRESAILMIADSFEAAGRSLDVMNEQTLTELVERLVGDKARDGQLDESHLTFEDLRKLKHALVQAMVNAGHPRIKYPHREEETIHVSDDEAPPPESTVG